MVSVVNFIERKLKLKVNHNKSGVRHCSAVKFLGYTLLEKGGMHFEVLIGELNQAIVGWTNYFQLANKWLSTIRDLDGWIRRKLRCYRLKQCGRRYTTYKLLRNLGIAEGTSWNVVMYSQGWWEMTRKVAVNQAMNVKWFTQLPLQSLYLRLQIISDTLTKIFLGYVCLHIYHIYCVCHASSFQ